MFTRELLEFSVEHTDFADLRQPKTQIMLECRETPKKPFAFHFCQIAESVLARMEFIIANSIGIHPLALLNFNQLSDNKLKAEIGLLTMGYPDKEAFFVDKLASGVGTIAAAFFPKDVIVRTSDFKTNEYVNLIGGKAYEPREENPMLGFRGASRYYNPRYRDGFALECKALKKVREEMGLTNLKIMIPFCRTPQEGKKVIAEMEKNGLKQGANGLEIYMMCEIPSNILLADKFAEIFDGFSIGSNDLTQLILGIDRDSEIIAPLFDERDPAVESMIALAITAFHARKRKVGICGQAPSDYPDFAKFLVACGIDSISLNPDAVVKTTRDILRMESGEPNFRGSNDKKSESDIKRL